MALGYHISKGKGFHETMQKAVDDHEISVVQVFVSIPRQRKMMNIDTKKFKEAVKRLKLDVYAHNAHVSHPWVSEASREHVKLQLQKCQELGIKGFVIHLPKNTLEVVMNVLPQIAHKKVTILLEIPSLKPDPDKSWETPERINKLCKDIRKKKDQKCEDMHRYFSYLCLWKRCFLQRNKQLIGSKSSNSLI